jgi:hypothetical protein
MKYEYLIIHLYFGYTLTTKYKNLVILTFFFPLTLAIENLQTRLFEHVGATPVANGCGFVSCEANRLVLGTSNAHWTPSHHSDSQLLTLVVRVQVIAKIITTKIFF